ncbi:MAG: nascent polypeptide-associated complex protein [Candidatus Diapherotrites archaeon]|nr:nascent polypeptide-associated complex protein [Candidatus Diapherotrites archaeon]
MMPMNPKQMEKMMAQLGIKHKPINATEVIIRMDGKEIVIKNPKVTEVTMQGIKTFQVVGDIEERERQPFTEEDVSLIMEQVGCSEEEAVAALKKHKGDIAEAIMELQD